MDSYEPYIWVWGGRNPLGPSYWKHWWVTLLLTEHCGLLLELEYMQHLISGFAVQWKKGDGFHYISPVFTEELWIILFLLCRFFGIKDWHYILHLAHSPSKIKVYIYGNYPLLKLLEISHTFLQFQVKVIEHQNPVTWLDFFPSKLITDNQHVWLVEVSSVCQNGFFRL